MGVVLRTYAPADCIVLLKLFYETVHNVNAKDYSVAQLNAWAPQSQDAEKWNSTFIANYTLVAEKYNTIVGFADVDDTGYFDHLFVHKDYQGKGIATLLADRIEEYAQKQKHQALNVAASITAKPFFSRRGYDVVKEQEVERNGQILKNYLMQKLLML